MNKIERLEVIPANWFCVFSARTDKPPCPEAVLYEVRRRDSRPLKNVEKTDWYERGVHHVTVDDVCYRDMGTEYCWFIEINDVVQFIAANGGCRFVPTDGKYTTVVLESDDE